MKPGIVLRLFLLFQIAGLILFFNTSACFAGTDNIRSFVARGEFGAIATGNPIATKAAANILKQGGNAVDAAVAAAFVLGVVNFTNSGLGGDAFALVHLPEGQIIAFDASSTRPASFKNNNSYIGLPTQPELQLKLLKLFGSLDRHKIFSQAIDLCHKGFEVSAYLNKVISKKLLDLTDQKALDFLAPEGFALPAGTILKQPQLGKTLQKMAEDNGHSFYKGRQAQLMIEQLNKLGSTYSLKDFASYRSKIKSPLAFAWQNFRLYGTPLPSSSLVAIKLAKHILNTGLEAFSSDAESMVAVAKAGREIIDFKYYCLSSYINNPEAFLLADSQTMGEKVGRIKQLEDSTQTTHLCVWDKNGMAVSMTLTLGSHCGTGNYSPLGFFYNNEMRNFTSLVARYPENYPPDSGPISSKAPLMVKKDGELFFILGGAGSDRIIFNNGLIIAALLSQKTTAYKAINSPRYFLDYKDVLQLEWRKNSRLTNELKRFRPESKIRQSGADYFGMVTFIGKSNEGFLAVSDFRRDASCTAIGQH